MSRENMGSTKAPHAVCVPFPAQGHINPMFKLAKILHSKGFHITFVHTEYNYNRLLKSRGPESVAGLPTFQFKTIPDGLPPQDSDVTQSIPPLCESTTTKSLLPFKNLLLKLNDDTSSPPVTCVVSDFIMSFTLEAADELGIPEFLLWTASACSLLAYNYIPALIAKGLVPFEDESYFTNGHLDTTIDFIPSLEGIRLKHIPTFIRTTNPEEFMLKFPTAEIERAKRATGIIFNAFDSLEGDVLSQLAQSFPPIYTIGPLQSLHNQIVGNSLDSLGSNLWVDAPECLEWLDKKEPSSVIYVNFGSITIMSHEQLVEFSWGLANSNLTFLWVVRPDLVCGESAILPSEFSTLTKERSLLVSWCSQEDVLSHPAVGGFLTHCGWNSTLDSIISGVPMICWSFFADQQINCWFSCNKWGVGMEIDENVKREEVERLVRELMVGEKGKELKKNAMEWKRKAEEACATSSGPSYVNLEKMIDQVLHFQKFN